MFDYSDHTFMICAYQENPYLENCILSILKQKRTGIVKMSTSTPNDYIVGLAKKYDLPLFINTGESSAADNWNFAYSKADTALVTLCHQDDYYFPNYLEVVIQQANKSQKPIIIYTDYCEDRNGVLVKSNKILRVKRVLNYLLQFQGMWERKWLRRRILSLGCPICCPAVTLSKNKVPEKPFSNQFLYAIDWKAWVDLACVDGDFIYCPQQLMAHRIWADSLTSFSIENGIRSKENLKILCGLWPAKFAKFINSFYSQAETSNKIS